MCRLFGLIDLFVVSWSNNADNFTMPLNFCFLNCDLNLRFFYFFLFLGSDYEIWKFFGIGKDRELEPWRLYHTLC